MSRGPVYELNSFKSMLQSSSHEKETPKMYLCVQKRCNIHNAYCNIPMTTPVMAPAVKTVNIKQQICSLTFLGQLG